jgi:predicted transcriptional regulator
VRTTIQVDKKVKERLRKLKIHPDESYNAVLERLIQLQVDACELSKEAVREIERGLEDARAGRTISMKEIKERLGMN